LQNHAVMSLAGLWDTWRPGTPLARRSFSVLTTAANRFMREIHDRMPVILDQSVIQDWLNPEIHERKDLQEVMKPCPDEWLSKAEVSQLVNSPKNNSLEVLEPAVAVDASDRPQRLLFRD